MIFNLISTGSYKTQMYEYIDKIKEKTNIKIIVEETEDEYCITHTNYYVEINTINDLLALKDAVGEELIITNETENGKQQIEIYDYWRE